MANVYIVLSGLQHEDRACGEGYCDETVMKVFDTKGKAVIYANELARDKTDRLRLMGDIRYFVRLNVEFPSEAWQYTYAIMDAGSECDEHYIRIAEHEVE